MNINKKNSENKNRVSTESFHPVKTEVFPSFFLLSIFLILPFNFSIKPVTEKKISTSTNVANTISGTVFEDIDGSTTYNVGDVGESGVTVTLYQDNNQDGQVDGGDTQVDVTTTNGSGYFSFNPNVTGSTQNFSRYVSAGSDDAEEYKGNGNVDNGSSDLELDYDPDAGQDQWIGIRFTNVSIPQGAVISNAYLTFYADGSYSTATDLTIYAQNADNAVTFSETNNNISNTGTRPRTSGISWNNVPAWTDNNTYSSPSVTTIVQQIVNRSGWSNGNAMAFIIEGSTARRRAESYNGSEGNPPRLVIDYAIPVYPIHYVMEINTGDLPAGATMVTDNVEIASFTADGQSDVNNNFGFSTNILPTAADDTDTTPEDVAVITDVTANDTDSDGTIDPTTVTITVNASNGSLSVNPVTGAVTYTPTLNYNGVDQYTYQVCDNDNGCDQAIVDITISPVNDDPVATNDAFTVNYNTLNQLLDVLNAGTPDSDVEGNSITITGAGTDGANGSTNQGGTVTINNNGTPLNPADDYVEYTPATDFVGYDSFQYTISDGSGGSDIATVTVSVLSSVEINCSNGFDDDNDGLIDCADPDCNPVTPVNIYRQD